MKKEDEENETWTDLIARSFIFGEKNELIEMSFVSMLLLKRSALAKIERK